MKFDFLLSVGVGIGVIVAALTWQINEAAKDIRDDIEKVRIECLRQQPESANVLVDTNTNGQ